VVINKENKYKNLTLEKKLIEAKKLLSEGTSKTFVCKKLLMLVYKCGHNKFNTLKYS